MTDRLSYEVVVVGGGPAGMTAALYATRLGHRTAVFEEEGGRHAAVEHVHNLYGVSEDVSGEELSRHAVDQFREYGGDYYLDAVDDVTRADDRFVVDSGHATVEADRVVLATGFTDDDPPVAELERYAGRGLFYCLHCDAYSLGDARTYVLGHDDHAAAVAMIMLNFTPAVDLLLDGAEPTWDDETTRQVERHPVDVVETAVDGAYPREESVDEPWLGGLTFVDGTERSYGGGFAMYGTEYNTELAEALGCETTDEGAIAVDDEGRTSVDGVYGVGDVTHGQNQTSIAIGDGARTGIALHKDLRRFPRPPEEEGAVDEVDVPAAAADVRSEMRLNRSTDVHAGLRDPSPRQ